MQINATRLFTTTFALCAIACLSAPDLQARVASRDKAVRVLQRGPASWYQMGRQTANGERFRPDGMTAAHRTLPFGTRLRVVHERTGRSIVVRINDRGPFIGGRVIDLARGPARMLGIAGVSMVSLHKLN